MTLPYYGVFDNLAYEVSGTTSSLYGQVTRPSKRSDAGRRVAKITGVQKVVNNIEVLLLSSFDDSIRRQTYRAVFNLAGLYRYAMRANPSIHIIVNGGHLTLEGVVNNRWTGNWLTWQRAVFLAHSQLRAICVWRRTKTELTKPAPLS